MTCCDAAIGDDLTTASGHGEVEEKTIRQASFMLDDGSIQSTFIVPDMHCAACIGTIERGLRKLPHVLNVRANLTNHTVAATWNPKDGSGQQIGHALEQLGFDQTLEDGEGNDEDHIANKGKRLLLSTAVAGFAAANIMLLSIAVWSGANAETTQLFHLISGFIAVPAVAYAGQPFFKSALSALTARRLNMDVPISLAILLATGMSVFESMTGGSEAYFDAAVTLTFFLLIGRYLDHLMREKARGAVQRLSRLSSKGSMRVASNGNTSYVSLPDIKPGMVLRVPPGEHFPVNGEIVSGATDVDRSLVTGEPEPVKCQKGMSIEAGVLNLTGCVDIRATSTSGTSFLAEIQRLMEAAENGRGTYVRLADRMARIYAPAVHLLALVTFVGWMFVSAGDWHTSIYTAIAVLIITCPCALGLAVPVVHVIGASRLLREGILIRDGSAFEKLSTVNSVVFDKTGTLTMGRPVVVEATGLEPKNAGLIYALASQSSHPAAKAISHFVGEHSPLNVETVESPGFGIEANYNRKRVRLGRPKWVAEIALLESGFCADNCIMFAIEGQAPTLFSLKDEVRPMAKKTIQTFQLQGMRLEVLSGDHNSNVSEVCSRLGIDDWRSELTPKDKVECILEMRRSGYKVLMVGDGLNDAPSLAAADISMAPASASDVGRLAADLVFTRVNLGAVTTAHSLARSTSRLIRQNFAIALMYNSIAVPLAMLGYITPLLAAIAMSASSITVILNSMRLNVNWQSSLPKPMPSKLPRPALSGNTTVDVPQSGIGSGVRI